MRPTTSKDPTAVKALKIEVGSLYFHEETPHKILMCTKITPYFILGITIHSPSPSEIGCVTEYSNTKVKLFNGKVTLDQSW